MSAQELVNCINQFALNYTNPVIAILPDNSVVEFEKKYPNPMLSFSGIGVRAYYHCHSSDNRPDTEHGHFHVFLKTDSEKWSHLAGLSMDKLGQPLEWFTVNHWVTGEAWITAPALEQQLNKLQKNEGQKLELVENWLLAMLNFYQKALNQLLRERDQEINAFLTEKTLESALEDRNIYILSKYKINLLNDLESYANLYDVEKPHPESRSD